LYEEYINSENKNTDLLPPMPSVLGQLNRQLGIQIEQGVLDGIEVPDTDKTKYDYWTITYITDSLKYDHSRDDNIVRSFTESSTLTGYDFIMNKASDLFKVIFEFDFFRQAIKIKTLEEVTAKTNIYLSFDNIMSELKTVEKADEIVTVLR
jgi:hypothetical protein